MSKTRETNYKINMSYIEYKYLQTASLSQILRGCDEIKYYLQSSIIDYDTNYLCLSEVSYLRDLISEVHLFSEEEEISQQASRVQTRLYLMSEDCYVIVDI